MSMNVGPDGWRHLARLLHLSYQLVGRSRRVAGDTIFGACELQHVWDKSERQTESHR
jgi:hypothetical protein